jgi:hypothetical protein
MEKIKLNIQKMSDDKFIDKIKAKNEKMLEKVENEMKFISDLCMDLKVNIK